VVTWLQRFAWSYVSVVVVASLISAVQGSPATPWWWGWWCQLFHFFAVMMLVETNPFLGRCRWRLWRHILPEGDVGHLNYVEDVVGQFQ
jgi:hypothetical protein